MTPKEELATRRRIAELESKQQGIISQPQRIGKRYKKPKEPLLPGLLTSHGNATLSMVGLGGDEVSGAIQSVLPYPYGPAGDSIQDKYRDARDLERERQARWNKEHPAASVIAPVTAGLGGAMVAGPHALKAGAKQFPKAAAHLANSPLSRYGVGVGAAGVGGGLSGYGYGEDLGDAGKGAAVAAGLTAIAAPMAMAAGWVGNKVWQGGNKAWNLLRSGDKRVMRKMGQALDDDGVPISEITKLMDDLDPQEALPIDVSPNMTAMGEQYAQIPGESKAAATKALLERARTSQQRIVRDLMEDTSSDLNIDAAVQRLHANMREIGKRYDPLFETPVEFNPKLQSLMQRKSVQDGIREAGNIASDEGDKAFESFMIVNPKTKELAWAKRPTLKAWDYVKRGLDDVIELGTDDSTGKLAPAAVRALKIKKELLAELDIAAPDYADIRRAYATEGAAERAIEAGRKVLRRNSDADTIARQVADMDEGTREFFRIGVAKELKDTVRAKQELFKPWKASPLQQDKIRAGLGKERGDKFIKRLEAESVFSTTKSTVLDNSATARRLQGMNEMNVDPSAVGDLATGNIPNLALKALQKDMQKVPPSMNRAAANLLYNPKTLRDPAVQQRIGAPLKNGGLLMDSTPEDFYKRLYGGASITGGLLSR
jgi:hypothetical protein